MSIAWYSGNLDDSFAVRFDGNNYLLSKQLPHICLSVIQFLAPKKFIIFRS